MPELVDILRYGRGVDNRRFKATGFEYRRTSAGAVEAFAEELRQRAHEALADLPGGGRRTIRRGRC